MGATQTHGLQPRPGHTPSKHASLSPALRQQWFLQTSPTLLKPAAQDPHARCLNPASNPSEKTEYWKHFPFYGFCHQT